MSIEITTLPTDTPASGDLMMFTDISETPDALNQCTIANLLAAFNASTTDVLTGTSTAANVTPDALAALWEKGSNVASASTVSLGEGGLFHITGTTTITDIDFATDKAGRFAILVFDGALSITYHPTNLLLPNNQDFTTAAGDVLLFASEGSDAVRCVGFMKRGAETFTAKTINLSNNTLSGTKAEFDTACSDADFGYLNIPQNAQTIDYTCVLADAGKHIYQTGATKTITIPANGTVAYPIGTAITFISNNATGLTIAITTDSLIWASTGGTGSRTLAQYGVATAIKITSTSWIISGTGLT